MNNQTGTWYCTGNWYNSLINAVRYTPDQSFDPRCLEVEIETPRGVSYTFSPLKSEFAFDKLVLNNFVASYKYTSLWQTSQYQSRRWAGILQYSMNTAGRIESGFNPQADGQVVDPTA